MTTSFLNLRCCGGVITLLLVLTGAWHCCNGDSIVSPGCLSSYARQFEHTYIVSGGKVRYHVRAPHECSSKCDLDPHSPVPCPAGYFEKEFVYGCQNCTGGCPECGGNWADCVLQDLFPNSCRYGPLSPSPGQQAAESGSRRFYRIRHCQKCHPSCKECNGPSDSDCTQCPNTGDYWAVNKQCLKIDWRFVHPAAYQCYADNHCFLHHAKQKFNPLPECGSNRTRLFPDQEFCLKCTHRHCETNCTHLAITPECAFHDLSDSYHCHNRFRYLAVKSRACIESKDACASNPCPKAHQCRSTLDWKGYACDCKKTPTGIDCPQLTYPHPVQPNIPPLSEEAGSGQETEEVATTPTPPTSVRTQQTDEATTSPLITARPQQRATAQPKESNSGRAIGLGVGCALVVLIAAVVGILVWRWRRQQYGATKVSHILVRFFSQSSADESLDTVASGLPSYSTMKHDESSLS